MKNFCAALLLVFPLITYAQDETVTFDYNGASYTVKVGDNIELGYGSNPYGSFMYLMYGAGEALPKERAGKTAVVTKIKYYKLSDVYRVTMKGDKIGWVYTDGFTQAVSKKEIAGINGKRFDEE